MAAPLSPAPEPIDAAAERWWLRLHSGAAGEAAHDEFRRWYDADPAHRDAYDGLAEVYDLLGESVSAAPRRRLPLLAAAAAVLVAVLAGGYGYEHWRADYATAVGEQRQLTLADGSQVALDADSALRVSFSDGERRITLLRGRAFFEVSPDPARPFRVAAGGGESRALGTAFAVADDGDRTLVTVAESRVEVSARDSAVTLAAGEQAWYSAAGVERSPAVDLDAAIGWRQGHLVFDDRPLAEVAAALTPYLPGDIVVLGEQARALRVSGVFSLRQPQQILAAIEASLQLRVYRLPFLTVIVAA